MDGSLREHFLIDPEIIFLNHGSYGACPRPVFETYQRWQAELERQPVAFFRRVHDLLAEARAVVAEYVQADPSALVFVTNATTGLNSVIRSLPLGPGDEILTTDHEYGALNRTWEYACGKTGAGYIHHPIPLPADDRREIVESFWSAVTPRTRVIYLSHITSPTALILPVAEICARARAAGILTVVDGAHAPGQVPVDLTALDVDFYAGNCHKWLSAPKGSGFLYVRPEHQAMIEPLVVSWSWEESAPFARRHQWQGTRDVAAYLSVPAAIAFQREHDWDSVRAHCHALASEARARLAELTGLPPLTPDAPDWFGQMITLPLPVDDLATLSRRLLEEHHIEIPVIGWNGLRGVRASFQGYNTRADLDALVEALRALLPQLAA